MSSSHPCTGLIILIIAYITILGPNEYIFMYNTSHITSSRLSNKPGYMILIGTPTQHYTPDYQPLEEKATAILTSLIYWSIYIWCPICSMSIAILYPIMTYPFLFPPAPKCLLIYQFYQVYPVNHFLTIYIVCISNLYNKNTSIPFEYVYSTGFPQHIPFICPLCMPLGLKITYIIRYILHRCRNPRGWARNARWQPKMPGS